MKEPSKLDTPSRLLLEPKANLQSGSRVIYSLLLGASLTIIGGILAVLMPKGYINVPSGVLSSSELLALASQPVQSGRLLPPLPSPNSSSTASNQSFLVYVEGDTPHLLAQVRQVAPGAFVRSHQGRRVIQTGLFTNQEYAQEQIVTLRSRGLVGQIAVSQPKSQPNLSGQKLLRVGNRLEARYSGPRQIVPSGETRDLTLTLVKSVLNSVGQIVLPAGSLIKGQVMPAPDGSRFLANSIQVRGTAYPLSARSATLGDVKASQHSTGAIFTMTPTVVVKGVVLNSRVVTKGTALPQRAADVAGSYITAQTTVIEPNVVITLQLTSDF